MSNEEMDMEHLQQELFRLVKERLPAHLSLVETIAGLLSISTDSAYRRIRGEKPMDLMEAKRICNQFNISLDAIMGLGGGRLIFTSNHSNTPGEFDYKEYLLSATKSMQYFHSFPEKKLYYECKDIPLFFHFHSKELAAFKYFFWQKYLFGSRETKKFSFDDYPDEMFEIGRRFYHLYATLPSVEFWNAESINSTIRQIDFYSDTGFFKSKDDVALVYTKLKELLSDIEQMSAAGMKKVVLQDEANVEPGRYEMFNNEVMLGGNTILAVIGVSRMVFLNHSVFHYAVTTDLAFGMYIQRYMENLARASTLISKVSEVERTAFFSLMQKAVQAKIDRL